LNKKNVLILATKGQTTNLLYNQLEQHFNVQKVIIENKISNKIILKNRIKNIGLRKVIGQVLFILTIPKLLSKFSKKRIKQIIKEANQNDSDIPKYKIINVSSINDKTVSKLINDSSPELIFVNGTRIISKQIIQSSNAKMVNIHVGITPKYRGVHGGYWAQYNKEPHLFGTTLHYIDSGIDTGDIIDQQIIKITNKDNFSTYPILQYCLGLVLIENNINTLHDPKYKTSIVQESRLNYHPTIWEFLRNLIN